MTWEQAEAAGAVCLPAAGFRNGSSVNNVGVFGYYWSSTAYNEYYVYFNSYNVYHDGGDRYSGCSVRLITECQ